MDYVKALEQAIIYIESHLKETIHAEDVAKQIGYSYYHLTRQFHAVLGEGVGSYIKKRRLADAAKQLLYTNRRIIDIAFDYGFESSEAFSRAFKTIYHVSLTIYRKNRIQLIISSKPKLDLLWIKHLTHHITVHPKIVTLPEIKVAGLRGQTTLKDNVLPKLWQKFITISNQISNKTPNARYFGICESCQEGNNLYTMNYSVLFSEVVSVEVSTFDNLPDSFISKTIQSGRYAVFTHTGSLSTLIQSFQYIFGTWFLSTKEQIDCREDFELYDKRYLGYDHEKSQIDLYIPIK